MRREAIAAVAALVSLAAAPAAAQTSLPFSQNNAASSDVSLPGADLRATLNETDELAVLDAIHTALATVGDGQSYVWHRNHGRLSGILQPTGSFRAPDGAPCRHLVVMLVAGRHVQKTEGIACRGADKRWTLAG
jgi:surface antigen